MTDAQQFEAFLKNHQALVFSTAMRLLANRAEAEDVTQEVFLKAYERFGELRESPTAGGWLRLTASSTCTCASPAARCNSPVISPAV